MTNREQNQEDLRRIGMRTTAEARQIYRAHMRLDIIEDDVGRLDDDGSDFYDQLAKLRRHVRGLYIIALVFLVIMLNGCAVYAEGGVGYRHNSISDQLLDTRQDWNGSNPTAEIALGLELIKAVRILGVTIQPHTVRCEIYHWSHVFDGGPFNDNPEQHENRSRCLLRGYIYPWGQRR